MAYYHTTVGQRHLSSGDMTVLICHVISQNNMTQEACGFLGGNTSR